METVSTPRPPPAPPKPKPPTRHVPPQPSPGSLPQTSQMPSADTAGFHAEARALWRAIHGDSPPLARPAFFPEAAYVRLKAIGDPRDDYTNRLLEDYALDIRTAHQLLGA